MSSYVGEGHGTPKSEGPVINTLSPKNIVKIIIFTLIACSFQNFLDTVNLQSTYTDIF